MNNHNAISILELLRLVFSHHTILDCDVKNEKTYNKKMLARNIKIEIFFNKITLAIDRTDLQNIPKTLFLFH